MTTAILVIVAIVIVGLITLAAISIKIVREYQRVVLFRLGRAIGPVGLVSPSSTPSPTGSRGSTYASSTWRSPIRRR